MKGHIEVCASLPPAPGVNAALSVTLQVVPAPSEGLLQQQLEVLRKICIPEVCFLFHALLHQSSHYKNVSMYYTL